MSIAAVAMVYK